MIGTLVCLLGVGLFITGLVVATDIVCQVCLIVIGVILFLLGGACAIMGA